MKNKLIAIESRIFDPETAGGVAQVIMSLAEGLSKLTDGDEEYVFVGYDGAEDWLGKYISGRCRLHIVQRPAWKTKLARSRLGPLAEKCRRYYRATRASLSPDALTPGAGILSKSDGTVESLGADLVHFTMQGAYLTDVPSIYHPHDLQHFHMPEYFDAKTLMWRLNAYLAYSTRARFVAIESAWTKQDVVNKLNIPPENVAVVPVPAPTLPAVEVKPGDAQRIAGFPRFIFYPAQTWQHKNHLKLLDALKILKQRYGLTVPLVCPGRKTNFFAEIERRIVDNGLAEQVRFPGYVSDYDLSAMYQLATVVVVPTKFESISLPIWESFAVGTPVACSRATSLPQQCAGASLLFDENNAEDIAQAIKQLWENDALRADLVRKGKARRDEFSRDYMIKQFRVLYRTALGITLTPEEQSIHNAPPSI